MRIAILVCAYPPFKGGIGNAAARHAHALVELGHEVDVLCPAHDSAPGTSVVDGVTVHRLRPVVSHGLSAFLPGLARRVGDYDGLLLEYPFFGGAEPAVLGARLSKTPYLVYFHMDVIWGGLRGALPQGAPPARRPVGAARGPPGTGELIRLRRSIPRSPTSTCPICASCRIRSTRTTFTPAPVERRTTSRAGYRPGASRRAVRRNDG